MKGNKQKNKRNKKQKNGGIILTQTDSAVA